MSMASSSIDSRPRMTIVERRGSKQSIASIRMVPLGCPKTVKYSTVLNFYKQTITFCLFSFSRSDSRVCSSHFEGGEKQDDPLSPAYIPSIFPKEQCNLKTSSVVSPSETEKEDHPLKISLVATKLSEEETPWQPVDEETVSCFGDEFLEIDCKKEVDMIDQSTQTTGTLETSDSLVWSCELEVNDEVSSCATMARVPSSKVIPPTWLKVSSQSTDLPSLESTIKVEY